MLNVSYSTPSETCVPRVYLRSTFGNIPSHLGSIFCWFSLNRWRNAKDRSVSLMQRSIFRWGHGIFGVVSGRSALRVKKGFELFLQDVHSLAPLESQQFSKCSSIFWWFCSANFAKKGIYGDFSLYSPFFDHILMKNSRNVTKVLTISYN